MRRIMNVVRYVLVFALNLYVMAVFHSYISFLFFLGMVLFPIYSAVGVGCIIKRSGLEVVPPAEAMYKGETAVLHFKLRNPTFFVLVNAVAQIELSNTFYGEDAHVSLNLPVRAKGLSTADWELKLESCGHITVKITSVMFTGLLGMLERKKAMDVCADFLILPCGETLEGEAGQAYLQGVSESAESRSKGYDFSEVSGIRDYIPGDKLQDIHWKLSAKQKELMVKERVNVSDMQLHVLLDLEDGAGRPLEAVLALSDGVTKGLMRRNLPFTVFYYSVNAQKLCSFWVGNEKERVQWLEHMMYDHHCDGAIRAEALFRRMYPDMTYLYIGTKSMQEDGKDTGGLIQPVAELRN